MKKNGMTWLALALIVWATGASAQAYPNRPVRLIIAFPPGSATDILARILAQKVGEAWGQNVVPDNRGGAGGSIGSAIAAKAPPDGYTIIINSGAHTVNPSMFASLPFDTLKDFVDITGLVGQPNVLVVGPASRFKAVKDFLADARANPNKITFAFAGLGSGTHLNTEKLKLAGKLQFTMVPYKGSGDAINDVVGGRVDTYFSPISAGLPFIQSGKMRALAVTSAKRAPQLANVPTLAESGLPGFEFMLWFGLWGPAGIPAPIVEKIHADFARAIADPGVSERLLQLGNTALGMTRPQFAKFVRDEIAVNRTIFQAAGIKPQ